jgi:hypothetical protein
MVSLADYASAVRGVTGSALSNKEIVVGVLKLSPDVRIKVCPELDRMIKDGNINLGLSSEIIKNLVNAVAAKYKLDSAVLYWIYLQWLKDK